MESARFRNSMRILDLRFLRVRGSYHAHTALADSICHDGEEVYPTRGARALGLELDLFTLAAARFVLTSNEVRELGF